MSWLGVAIPKKEVEKWTTYEEGNKAAVLGKQIRLEAIRFVGICCRMLLLETFKRKQFLLEGFRTGEFFQTVRNRRSYCEKQLLQEEWYACCTVDRSPLDQIFMKPPLNCLGLILLSLIALSRMFSMLFSVPEIDDGICAALGRSPLDQIFMKPAELPGKPLVCNCRASLP